MEEMFRYDLRLNYILNQETPSYKTIMDFINEVIVPNSYLFFTMITETLIGQLKINIDDQYLDGTKIEANANKYKFVYKPRKHRNNLNKKILELLKIIDEEYEEKDGRISAVELSVYLRYYAEKEKIDVYSIPSGKGTKLSKAQKLLKTGYSYLYKLLEYEEKEIICGPDRNSYYKTDHDATAMA